MNNFSLILLILAYFGLIFLIAYWSEKNVKSKWVNNPYVYTLSLGIYCSAWTYYGSVGIAASSGIGFLTTYLGPVIAMPVWILLMRKILRISKHQKISSIADFISVRYGNNRIIGAIVTVLCLIGILPYISLQLKAISETFEIIALGHDLKNENIFFDFTFYIAILLALFAAFFGTQTADATDKRRGIVFTVAIESLVKLLFFLLIGCYVTFYLYEGTSDLYEQAKQQLDMAKLTTFQDINGGFNWFYMIVISFIAIFLLPRQFQISVVSNERERHLKVAIWLFPLYLLLFNIFVMYIAWGGNLTFAGESVNPDYYTILLPLKNGDLWLALLVFIGGFSAVISMVVVSTVALSNMVSNNLIIPYGFLDTLNKNKPEKNASYIKNIRRFSIFSLIVIAYVFYFNFSKEISLFSIGYISFVIIAQLAPSFFIGMYWNRGSSLGAITGIISGFIVTCYTLIIPFILDAIMGDTSFIDNGLLGLKMLKPYELFGLQLLNPITHAFMWSMLINILMYLIFSLYVKVNYRERNYAEMFVKSSDNALMSEAIYVWKGEAYVADIRRVLERFLGQEKATRAIDLFYTKYNLSKNTVMADARLINFSEKLLTGTIGSASSKILISSVVKEQPISLPEVLKILEESKETISNNKFLKEKSMQLTKLTAQLQTVNEELIVKDQQKDDFLDTVAHELKTPITAIKAAAEVLLLEDDEMPDVLKERFLQNIVEDTERLAKLINNILDLEKLATGREKMEVRQHDLLQTIEYALHYVENLAQSKQIRIENHVKNRKISYDEDRMLQVFINLLSNAIKFVDAGTGYINIHAYTQEDFIFISIEDNGRGISDEDFEYIFDKFYQSKYQNTKKPQGSGFGLSICKHIVNSHKGDIWAERVVKGARFVVKLPL